MTGIYKTKIHAWTLQLIGAGLLWAALGVAYADTAEVNSAASLRAKYAALLDQLSNNPFRKPVYLDSRQSSGDLNGEVYARIDYPFAAVKGALTESTPWCDILILHLNVKYCRVVAGKSGSVLKTYLGTKHDEPLAAAQRIDLALRVAENTIDYLRVLLSADTGPYSTRNYRIALEAVPLNGGHTFIHLSYSYAYGLMAKLAIQTYLATFGGNKVGFTVIDKQPDGRPIHVGGVRGILERNAMRYYLAIDAYLGAASSPAAQQFEKRLRDWYALTERYPRQLHELEQGEYLSMKRKEFERQQTEP
jgi:hypothetical protein